MKTKQSTHYFDETINGQLPFIAGLTSTVRDEIISQVEHLSNLSNTPNDDVEDNVRFRYMADGARTVLNIIENTAWGKSGTSNWLSKMDLSQLEYAAKEASRMIEVKKDEGKETLYFATCMHFYFSTPIESKANEWIFNKLADMASGSSKVTRHKTKNPFTDQNFSVGIEERRIRLSEINDNLSEEEKIPDEHLVSSEAFTNYVKNKQATT